MAVVKMARKPAPAPAEEPAPTKKVRAEKTEEKKERKPRYAGKTTGMGIREFQNASLLQNEREHLTDAALAKRWRDEFPMAAKFDEVTVRGVRGLMNKGKHGNDIPKKPLHGYDPEGNQIPNRGEGKPAADAKPAKSKK